MFSSQTASQNRLGNRPTDRSLAKLMTSYWVSFIADLNPNDSQCESFEVPIGVERELM